jgi:hypothetical protein
MQSNTVNDSLVGFAYNGFGHTSDSQQRKREWNIVVDKINNADVDWLNGNVFTNIADAGKPVSDYLNKWHPNHNADQDLVDHFAASVVLKERVGGALALTIGIVKEVMDIFTSSVGYSNDDLATDFAGALGYNASEALAAGLFNHTNSEYDSSDMGWVDNTRKLIDLIDPDVTQSTADFKYSSEIWKMVNGVDKDADIQIDLSPWHKDCGNLKGGFSCAIDEYVTPVDLYTTPVELTWPVGAAEPWEFYTTKNNRNNSWNTNNWGFVAAKYAYEYYSTSYHSYQKWVPTADPWGEYITIDMPPRSKKNVLVKIPKSIIITSNKTIHTNTGFRSTVERFSLPDEDGSNWTDNGSPCTARCDIIVTGSSVREHNTDVMIESLSFINCVRIKQETQVETISPVVVPVVTNTTDTVVVPMEVNELGLDKSLSDVAVTMDGEEVASSKYSYNSITNEIIFDDDIVGDVSLTTSWLDLAYDGDHFEFDDLTGLPIMGSLPWLPGDDYYNPYIYTPGAGDFIYDEPHTITTVEDWFAGNTYEQADNGVVKDWGSPAKLAADPRTRNVSAVTTTNTWIGDNLVPCDYITFEHNCPACQSELVDYPNNTWLRYEVTYNCG